MPPGRRRAIAVSCLVPDWLPALVNAGRTFIAICVVELFWIVTAWPNGAFTQGRSGLCLRDGLYDRPHRRFRRDHRIRSAP
jgi:hypothetical protein